MATQSDVCSEFGPWQAYFSKWGLFGGGAFMAIIAAGLLCAWCLELKKAVAKEKEKRQKWTKQPWLKKKGISTQAIASALMVATQLSAVVYYACGFGVSKTALCDGPAGSRLVLNTLHAIITAGNFLVVCEFVPLVPWVCSILAFAAQILKAWLRSLSVLGEKPTTWLPFQRKAGKWVLRLCIDTPIAFSIILVPVLYLSGVTVLTPTSRLQLSLAFRVLPATACALVPVVYGLPMISALASGSQESSQRLAKKMLSLVYLFVTAALLCLPVYICLLATSWLSIPGVWLSWAVVEAAWYFVLAWQLLRVFNPKYTSQVQPSPSVISPKLRTNRMDSFVIGLGSSVWNFANSTSRLSDVELGAAPKNRPSQPTSLSTNASAQSSSSREQSDPTSMVHQGTAGEATAPLPSTSISEELDRKQSDRAARDLRNTFGSDVGSQSNTSPGFETQSMPETPLAGSSTLLNAIVSDSIQSYADLKPLQQLLRAHSMRGHSGQPKNQLQSTAASDRETPGVRRLSTAPPTSQVWNSIDQQVESVGQLTASTARTKTDDGANLEYSPEVSTIILP